MNSPFFDDNQVHRGCTKCPNRISWEFYRNFEMPLCIKCARALMINITLTNIIVMISSLLAPSLVSLALYILGFEFSSVSFITTYFIFAAPYGWTFMSRISAEEKSEKGISISPLLSIYKMLKAISFGWIVFPYELPQFIMSAINLYKVNSMFKRAEKKRALQVEF